jgi:hypothetical protein
MALCEPGSSADFTNLWSTGSARDNTTNGKRVARGVDQPRSTDINELRSEVEDLLTPGQSFSQTYQENRRDMGIKMGSITQEGEVVYNPGGWSCSRANNARYTITHNLGTYDYAVIGTCYTVNDTPRERMLNVQSKGLNSVVIAIQNEDGHDKYNFFDLMLVEL